MEDEAFPRGGGSVLSPLERRKGEKRMLKLPAGVGCQRRKQSTKNQRGGLRTGP
eukprot:jgi/Botrbrau1/20979/Bobra.0789s0001.1